MQHIKELTAFIAVVETGSFTKAASRLRLSQSALSHSIRKLENQLNLKLLNRTTRSVSPTEAGERLYHTIAPRFAEIEQELADLQESQGQVAGLIRITMTEHPLVWFVWQRLSAVLKQHPELRVELNSETRFTDIVRDRYDIGIRWGEDLAQDMIAVRVSPDVRMVVVGSPDYFAKHGKPQTPTDLHAHHCVCVRLPTHGRLLDWEFQVNGKIESIPLKGKVLTNCIQGLLRPVQDGVALAWVTEDLAEEGLRNGSLVSVLDDYAITLEGYHLYYSNRKSSGALKAVIEALRWKGEQAV